MNLKKRVLKMNEVMMKKTITAHMIVKNEERWVWYSIMSVIDYVDKMIIFDTGSTDKTVFIIRKILESKMYNKKIIFEEKEAVSEQNFFLLRQEQIEKTNTDYFLVVDGDEIWYKDTLERLQVLINNQDGKIDLVAVKFINCAGDIYHYRDFKRESYCIEKIKGSITIRLYSMNIDGIKCAGNYGVEGYFDKKNKPVQESEWKIAILDGFYLHTSLLQRSGEIQGDFCIKYRRKKIGSDWDYKFDNDFKYPEVFYLGRPSYVYNPWNKRIGLIEKLFYFLRKIKRFG